MSNLQRTKITPNLYVLFTGNYSAFFDIVNRYGPYCQIKFNMPRRNWLTGDVHIPKCPPFTVGILTLTCRFRIVDFGNRITPPRVILFVTIEKKLFSLLSFKNPLKNRDNALQLLNDKLFFRGECYENESKSIYEGPDLHFGPFGDRQYECIRPEPDSGGKLGQGKSRLDRDGDKRGVRRRR